MTLESSAQSYLCLPELREILTKNNEKYDPEFGEKIYISRKKQVLRFIENEKEVTELLEKYGFKKVIAEDFSYDQQIAIFANAKYIVGPHGAGITNILFMKEGTTLLELSPPPEDEKPVTDYFRISSPLKIKYVFQQCEIGERSQVKDFHHGSLIVDLAQLEKNLKLMLN